MVSEAPWSRKSQSVGLLVLFFLSQSGCSTDPTVTPVEPLPSTTVAPTIVTEPTATTEEAPDEPNIEELAGKYGVSLETAERIAMFEDDPMQRVAEGVFTEFEASLITIEQPHEGSLIFYVSRDAAAIERLARRLLGDDPGRIEVRSGFLPLEVVEEHWERVEGELDRQGLLGWGALGPNEITVGTPDIERAKEIVDKLNLPPGINVIYEFGLGVEDL